MNPTKPIEARVDLIAACGLYCGACPSHLKGKCPGCKGNNKATWCKVRTCNLERGTSNCSQCADHPDPMACKKYNNVISTVVGFVFNSNRSACIKQIREMGAQSYAQKMASAGRMTIKRRGNTGM